MFKSSFWGAFIGLMCLVGFYSCKPNASCAVSELEINLFEGLRIPDGNEWKDTLAPSDIWRNQNNYSLAGPEGWDSYEWKVIVPDDTTLIDFGQNIQIQTNFPPSSDQKEIIVELELQNDTDQRACILTQSFPFYDVAEPFPTIIIGKYQGSTKASPLDTFDFEIRLEEVQIGQITVYQHVIQNFPKSCRFSFSIGDNYASFFLNTGNQLGQGCEKLRASGIFYEDTNQIWIKYQTKAGSAWEKYVFIGKKIL